MIAELREWANDGAVKFQQVDAVARTQKLLDRPDKPDDGPEWGGRSKRALIAKRIILESKASGKWGPEAVGPALEGLAAMDRGEPAAGPSSLTGAITEAYGRSTREEDGEWTF